MNPARPHRAHLEILGQLALPQRLAWMRRQGRPANFAGLLAAWLDALDTEELNRRFYRELFGWFERAVKIAKFPTGPAGNIAKEEQVIRLITRLLFVWFVKEKGLIAEDLFVEHQVARLLKDYDREAGGFLLSGGAAKPVFRHAEHGNRAAGVQQRGQFHPPGLFPVSL